MPRKTARRSVLINKWMNEMGGTNPKPFIAKKRTLTKKRYHYEEIDEFGGSASFPSEYWGNDANIRMQTEALERGASSGNGTKNEISPGGETEGEE